LSRHVGIDRILGAADNNTVWVVFPQGQSSAEHCQYMKARFEFLALKTEVGRASPKEISEMRALQHAYEIRARKDHRGFDLISRRAAIWSIVVWRT
jgi:hypothetical protein